MRLHGLLALILLLLISALPQQARAAPQPLTIHVSPTGDDYGPGTKLRPLRTLTAARDMVRARKDRTQPVVVELEAGRFEFGGSFRLDSSDSGTAEAPIVYRANPGAMLSGSRSVPDGAVGTVTDPAVKARLDPSVRDRVRQIDLGELGISDPVNRAPQVTGADRPTGVEPVQGDSMGHDARYPDRGSELRIAAVHADGDNPVWRIDDRTPFTWAPSSDLWAEGYPGFDWAYQLQRVISLDPANATITLDTPAEFGSRAGQPFYFRHVLEALNQPDEFYVDEASGLMYFLPTGDPLSLTVATEPLIVGEGVSHVRFEGLHLSETRGDGMRFTGGRAIDIHGGTFTNLGLTAIHFTDVADSVVDSVRISRVGRGGITMSGGDRDSLTPGNNLVSNNTIDQFSETYPRYSPGITLAGVGNIARNNEVFNAPHLAIQLRGNDHRIEHNYVHDVVLDASDSGALHGGRDWTERGNVIAHNIFARVGPGAHDVPAVYLDDMMSGTTVRQNLIVDSAVGVQHNGRDNDITSNVLVRTERPVYVGNWSRAISGQGGELEQRLHKVPYKSQAWAKYPNLATILEDDPQEQKYNTVTANALIDSGSISVEEATRGGVTQRDNRVVPAASIVIGEDPAGYAVPEGSRLNRIPGMQVLNPASVGPHAKGAPAPAPTNSEPSGRLGLLAAGAGALAVVVVGSAAWWWSRRGQRPAA